MSVGSRTADSVTAAAAGPGVPAPYGRACTNCSKAKYRCVYRGSGLGTGACERCHRLNKPCVPSETVRKRTPRRQIVSRTAQLEEKLNDLVSLLKTQRKGREEVRKDSGATTASEPSSERRSQGSKPLAPAGRGDINNGVLAFSDPKAAMPAIPSPPSSLGVTEQPRQTPGDAGDAAAGNGAASASPSCPLSVAGLSPCTGSPTELEAEECLEAFRSRFMLFFPFIYISPSMTARQLQQERPLTMLAIQSVTSKSLSRQQELGGELRSLIAHKAVFEHDSSLDLFLAILTYIGWGHFHKRDKPFMTVFTRLATAQLMELGLHRPFGDIPALQCWKHPFPNPEQLVRRRPTNEERRAALGCYCQCSLGLFVMKRIDSLRWTAYLEEMMRDLEKEYEHDGDLVLIAHVKINQVIEQLHSARAHICDNAPTRWQIGETYAAVDCSKGLPSYYISFLRSRARDVRASLPERIQTHDAVEPMLLSLDLMIYEASLTRPRSPGSTQDQAPSQLATDPQQIENMHNCVETIDRYFTRVFSIPTAYYHGFSFANCAQSMHALVTLFRLSVYDDPLWDRAALRRRLDLLKLVDVMMERAMEVPKLAGLEAGPDPRRHPGEAGADGKGRPADVFSKGWSLMQMLRSGWEAELNKLDAASRNGAGAGGRGAGTAAAQSSSAAVSAVTSTGAGTGAPMMSDADGQLSHQRHQLVISAMDLQQQQQPAPFGMYDPFSGVMVPLAPEAPAEQGWFQDMFYPWDRQNSVLNWATMLG